MVYAFSNFSENFVSPLFPGRGDETSISIAIAGVVEDVLLRIDNSSGLMDNVRMQADGTFGKGRLYKAVFRFPSTDQHVRYYFSIHEKKDVVYYYSKNGITRSVPSLKHRFEIIPGLVSPGWVASSTCYQIFPDRFANGDPSNDVSSGAYSFDGAEVKAMEWGEVPLEFDRARCLDFYNGDLKGIEDKLDYIASLGFDAIYLNPVNSSLTVHRYDSIDFFKVDEKLGGDRAYESLIRKAHEKGIRIIQDISINHTGSAHPWFLKALEDPSCEEGSFYYKEKDGSYCCWAGTATLPQLNFNSQVLRNLLYRDENSAMQKYLRAPFGIDAWRLDVAPELGRKEDDQMCLEVWREVKRCLKSVRNDLYLVGEDWDDSSSYMQGDAWDGTMNYYGSGRPLRAWMGEQDRFESGGWGHSPARIEPFTSYDMVSAFKEALDAVPDQNTYFQMNLIDSHDTPRLHNNDLVMDDDVYLGVILALYMLPGMPSIYYGDEVKLAGRMGSVEGSRYPMQWKEEDWNRRYLEWFKKLGRIRKRFNPGFSAIRFRIVDEQCFIIYRFTREGVLCAFINRGEERTVSVDDEFVAFPDTFELLLGDLERDKQGYVRLKRRRSALVLLK